MENDICVVLAYCDNDHKVDLLKKCILDLKSKNKKIFISSHYPISFDIQKMVDYYYYDSDNEVLTHQNGGILKYNINTWSWEIINHYMISYNYSHLNSKILVHSYAIWTLIRNAIIAIKTKGFKKIHILEYDVLIGDSNMLEEHNQILNEKECVYYYSGYLRNIFSMSTEASEKIFSLYSTAYDFYIKEKLDFLFENRLYQLLSINKINCHEFPGYELEKKTTYLNANSEAGNLDRHIYFYENEYFYFLIISDVSRTNNYLFIDNKKFEPYICKILIDNKTVVLNISELRHCIPLDEKKDQYKLMFLVDDKIVFNNDIKVKDYIYYEK